MTPTWVGDTEMGGDVWVGHRGVGVGGDAGGDAWVETHANAVVHTIIETLCNMTIDTDQHDHIPQANWHSLWRATTIISGRATALATDGSTPR